MESLVAPVLILLAVLAAVLLTVRALGKRKPAGSSASVAADKPSAAGVDLARSAAANLSEEQHRRIYALIAQGQAVAAIKVYFDATGGGLRASRDAVAALAAHPQPYRHPQPSTPAPAVEDAAGPERFTYRYRAIASKGELTREVSSNMLNDEIYGQIRTLAQSGETEAAATALKRHSDVSLDQAREFIALLAD
ncbi:hypothetical protein PSET11_00717 [Arthrobacter ulcerisalmonis]|uniref:50S ribosomal protein L7/L12 n=1 Tax=Arthrobacter ulcerisalmonis TaxID=2483813 RepID=A0A3P5WIQ8_9MICC|nr:hypothetical protein [Arthrobacter ulcerisalmonis]VDC21355.1 hypothetical protein PSET11_00717 [Arthrobacter ulcerisalmonis]